MTTQPLDGAHVEELMLDAEEAIEASRLPKDDRQGVDLGLGEIGGTRATINVEDAGYVRVWDRRTGEESVVMKHADYLRAQLEKRDPATGQRVFTTVRPTIRPFRGEFKCVLHPEAEDAELYRSQGLPTCQKSNLRNAGEVERHLRVKHRETFQLLERNREREIEEEERLFRRSMFSQIGVQAQAAKNPEAATVSQTCTCGEVLTAKNQGGLNFKQNAHNKVCPDKN